MGRTMDTSVPIWNFPCGPIRRGRGFLLPDDSTWILWLLSNFYRAPMRRFMSRAGVDCAKSLCAANGFPTADYRSAARIEIPRSSFVLIEVHCLELGEDSADKNLRLDPERNAIGIVRNPDRRAPEFPMRL